MTAKDRLLHQLIDVIKPPKMCSSEYIIQCAIRAVDVSLDNPIFMHWVINEAYNNFNKEPFQKVRDLIIKGLKKHFILDFTKDIDCSYISEILPLLVLRERCVKTETEKFFRVILEEYRHTLVGEEAYRLNRAFGLTSMCYFSDNIDGIKLTA